MLEHSRRWSLLAMLGMGLSATLACGSAAGAAAGATTVAAASPSGPSALIDSVARTLLTNIDAHREEYRKNSADLNEAVRRLLLPYLDTTFTAQLVLGPNWRTASVTQRKRFTDTFIRSLVRNYASELVDFSLDRLQVFPYRGNPKAADARVDTVVSRRNGDRTNVNYSLLHTKQGWKVYDMTFDGVSYVESFRDDFREEVEQKGLDQLISHLESEQLAGATS